MLGTHVLFVKVDKIFDKNLYLYIFITLTFNQKDMFFNYNNRCHLQLHEHFY